MLQGLRTSPNRRQPATTTPLWDLCSDTSDMTLLYRYLTNLQIPSLSFLRHGDILLLIFRIPCFFLFFFSFSARLSTPPGTCRLHLAPQKSINNVKLNHVGQNPSGLRHLTLPPSALQSRETVVKVPFPAPITIQ